MNNFIHHKPTPEEMERFLPMVNEYQRKNQRKQRQQQQQREQQERRYYRQQLKQEQQERQRLIQQHQQEMRAEAEAEAEAEARRRKQWQQLKQQQAEQKALAWTITWKAIQLLLAFLFVFASSKFLPSPQVPTPTASKLPEVVLPEESAVLMNSFVFDGPLLKKSMTPARLNQVEGEALFEVIERITEPSVEKIKCCPVDDIPCRISAVAPKYIPGFLKPYLLGPQEEDADDDDNPIDFNDWVVTVCDQSIWSETTPAFLSHGATDEDSGISFFQMTQGHSRNPDPEEIDLELQHLFEDDLEVCAESDSLFDIVSRLFTFTENSRVQETVWHVQPPLAPQSNFRRIRRTSESALSGTTGRSLSLSTAGNGTLRGDEAKPRLWINV